MGFNCPSTPPTPAAYHGTGVTLKPSEPVPSELNFNVQDLPIKKFHIFSAQMTTD